MFLAKRNLTKAVRRSLLVVTCMIAIILAGCGGSNQQNLGPVVRADSPDFEKYKQLIKIEDLEATEASRPIGDIQMRLEATVRNFTGRTLNGLEVRAAVVDLQDKPVKERTIMVIPNQQPELENNKTMKAAALLEGMTKNDVRANIRMEVTGFRFK